MLYVPSDDDALESLELAAEPAAVETVPEAPATAAADADFALAAADEDIVLAAAEEPATVEPEALQALAEAADEPFTFDLRAPAADADATLVDELSFALDGSLADDVPSAAVGGDAAAVQVEEISLEDLSALDFAELQGTGTADEEISLDSVSLSADTGTIDFDAGEGLSLDGLFSSDEQAEFDKLLAAVAPAESPAPVATAPLGAGGGRGVTAGGRRPRLRWPRSTAQTAAMSTSANSTRCWPMRRAPRPTPRPGPRRKPSRPVPRPPPPRRPSSTPPTAPRPRPPPRPKPKPPPRGPKPRRTRVRPRKPPHRRAAKPNAPRPSRLPPKPPNARAPRKPPRANAPRRRAAAPASATSCCRRSPTTCSPKAASTCPTWTRICSRSSCRKAATSSITPTA
jgi:hypothetical protein